MYITACALLMVAVMAGQVGCDTTRVVQQPVNSSVVLAANKGACRTLVKIEWIQKEETVCDWKQGDSQYTCYGKYNSTAELNIETGDLKLNNLQFSDSGRYTVKLNSMLRVHNKYALLVIEPVPRPTVVLTPPDCNSTFPKCTLTCDLKDYIGDVHYVWHTEVGWTPGELTLTIDNKTANIEQYDCAVVNGVSVETSYPIKNPFYVPRGWWVYYVVIPLVIVTVGLLLLVCFLTMWYASLRKEEQHDFKEKCRCCVCFYQKL